MVVLLVIVACCTCWRFTVRVLWGGASFSILHEPLCHRSRAWVRETFRSSFTTISLLLARPMVTDDLRMGKVCPARGPLRNLIDREPGGILSSFMCCLLSRATARVAPTIRDRVGATLAVALNL